MYYSYERKAKNFAIYTSNKWEQTSSGSQIKSIMWSMIFPIWSIKKLVKEITFHVKGRLMFFVMTRMNGTDEIEKKKKKRLQDFFAAYMQFSGVFELTRLLNISWNEPNYPFCWVAW